MASNLCIIIGHNLTPTEIIKFPNFLDNCQELKDIYISEIQSKLDHHDSVDKVLENVQKKTDWGRWTLNETHILKVWTNNSIPKLVDENGYFEITLTTYFGWIHFNERTINMTYLPEHKYPNLWYESHRRFILRFSRAMAKLLGQTKIVYTGESHVTGDVEDESTEGRSIDEIINYGTLRFGDAPISLIENIDKGFFIEDTINPFADFIGNMKYA